MGRNTARRAVLLNKGDKSKYINKEDFKEFLKEFLKASKEQIASPPTAFEKALILAKPTEEKKRYSPAKKVILPELLAKTTTPKKKKTSPKKTLPKKTSPKKTSPKKTSKK